MTGQPPARGPEPTRFGGMQLAGLGVATAGCLAAGLVLGGLVDSALGTAPLFLLVGLALGIILGVLGSFQRIRRYLRD